MGRVGAIWYDMQERKTSLDDFIKYTDKIIKLHVSYNVIYYAERALENRDFSNFSDSRSSFARHDTVRIILDETFDVRIKRSMTRIFDKRKRYG